MTVAVDAKLAAKLVRGLESRFAKAASRGIVRGAMRARAKIQRETPKDQGQTKASWRLERSALIATGDHVLATWTNDAPHAGILENGARPHNVNPEGWQAIYRWVERHRSLFSGGGAAKRREDFTPAPFRGPDPQIEAITNGIVRKIAREGQKPTYFVRNMLDDLTRMAEQETQAVVDAEMRAARAP